MKKIYLLAFILFTGLIACNSRSALWYNNQIVAKEKALATEVKTTEEAVEKFAKLEKFDSVAAVAGKMEILIDTKIAEIKAIPEPGATGIQDFKKAYLEYFEYLKSIYTAYKNVGLAKTPDARQQEITKMQNIISTQSAVLRKMKAAQRKFGADNGFKVEAK